jgi:hypothetical protein
MADGIDRPELGPRLLSFHLSFAKWPTPIHPLVLELLELAVGDSGECPNARRYKNLSRRGCSGLA